MPRKYEVIDNLIKDELKEFLLWLGEAKHLELCKGEYWSMAKFNDENIIHYYPIHKAPEDLINEYMEIYNDC